MDDHNQLDHIESKLDNQHNHSSEWLYFDPGRLWDGIDQHYYLYQQQQQQEEEDNYTFFSTSSFYHHHHLPSHFHFDPFTDFQCYFIDNLHHSNNNVEDDKKRELVGATTTTTRMMMIMNDGGDNNIIDQFCRSTGRSPPSSKPAGGIGLEEIQKYFDVPIIKAAKELKIGLTVLKKRCRELNISRWPHRKIKSLNALIHNFKELGKSRKDIEMLEEHKRMLEKEPELDLTDRTKRLRQACFKLNYKKRRSLPS